MTGARTTSIQSVQRALRILSLFTADQPLWTVGDISRTLALNKSVVSRFLATMAVEGFVTQDATTKAYAIGPQAFAVGSTYRPFVVLEAILRPAMANLTAKTGQSTSTGVPSGHVFTIIHTVQGTGSIRVAFDIGQRPYYHSAAIGKLLLAAKSDGDVRAIVGPDPLPKVTPWTIGTVSELFSDLEQIRRTGIAISSQESIPGVGAVAAGIRNAKGECIAGISVVYPTHVVSDAEIRQYSMLTMETAQQLSGKLTSSALGSAEVD